MTDLPIALTRLAWIDALTPLQALLLWILICACWLAGLAYALLGRHGIRPSRPSRSAHSSRKEIL